MKKQSYIAPATRRYHTICEGYLLAGTNDTGKAWDVNDPNNPKPPTSIKDENDKNLGGEGTEITGAKHNTSWGFWGI